MPDQGAGFQEGGLAGAPPGVSVRVHERDSKDGTHGYVSFSGIVNSGGRWTAMFDTNDLFGNPKHKTAINFDISDISVSGSEDLPHELRVGHTIPEIKLSTVGGTPPYTYLRFEPNPLPDGLTFNEATGALSGTPKKPGPYHFWLGAKDFHGRGAKDVGPIGWKEFKGTII
jgi:hypothetical protein